MAVGDYDGDGHDDIYFCNQLGKNALYHNKGDGTFEEVAEKLGVALGDRVCVAAVFVDYDNSGNQSLFITSMRGGNVMFHNKGKGVFEDVTEKVGLKHVGHSQAALFFDYDNDGYLDLLLTNTAEWTSEEKDDQGHHFKGGDLGQIEVKPKEANILYHNEPVDPKDPSKGRKFVKMPDKCGLKGRGWAGDAVAFDYDGDGFMDVFVTGMFGRCQLYRNKGDGTFEDVTLNVLGKTPNGAIGGNVFDYTNNGQLSIIVMDMHSDMWMGTDVIRKFEPEARENQHKKFPTGFGPRWDTLDPETKEQSLQREKELGIDRNQLIYGNALYRNDGKGKFEEVSDKAGMETFWPWGTVAGDFLNNGREDVFITAGMGYPFWYWPNSLMMNNGDGTFTDKAEEMGIEPPPRGTELPEKINAYPAVRSSRCAATGDFFGDGRLAIVVNNFNDQPYFYKNQVPAKNWVAFQLTGRKHEGGRCNRDAIGAVVRLYRDGGKTVMTRQVKVSGGYLAQSSKTLHFGLGDSKDFDRVEITWPGRRHPQVLTKVNVNAINPITEPEGDDT